MTAVNRLTCPVSCRDLVSSEQEFSLKCTCLVKEVLCFLLTVLSPLKKTPKGKKEKKKKTSKINPFNSHWISLRGLQHGFLIVMHKFV